MLKVALVVQVRALESSLCLDVSVSTGISNANDPEEDREERREN